MKNSILWTIVFIGLSVWSFGQQELPNGSFENWTGNLPDQWSTSNSPNGNTNNITPVSPGYAGAYAVKGTVIPYPYTPGFPMLPFVDINADREVFSMDRLYPALNLYYQFHPVASGDILSIFVAVMDQEGTPFGGGGVEITHPANSYKALSIPIYYYAELPPASIRVYITISDNVANELPALDSYFIVDELTFGDLISNGNDPRPRAVAVNNIYSNPRDSQAFIDFLLARNEHVNLELFGRSRQQVDQGFSRMPEAGEYQFPVEPGELPESLHLCHLSTFGGAMMKKARAAQN